MIIYKTNIAVGGYGDDEDSRYRISVNLLDFLRRISADTNWVVRFDSLENIVYIRIDQDIEDGQIKDSIGEYILTITSRDWLDWVLAVPMGRIIYKYYNIPEEFVQMFLDWSAKKLVASGFINQTIRSDAVQGIFIRASLPGDIYIFRERVCAYLWNLFDQNAYLTTNREFISNWKLSPNEEGYYTPKWGKHCPRLFDIQSNYGSVFTFLHVAENSQNNRINVLWYDTILKDIHSLDDLIIEIRSLTTY